MKQIITRLLLEIIQSENPFKSSLVNRIVYHGTRSKTNFKLFDPSKITGLGGEHYGKGFYFTTNLDYAKSFGNTILECYINVQYPLDLYNHNINELQHIIDQMGTDEMQGRGFTRQYKDMAQATLNLNAPTSTFRNIIQDKKGLKYIKNTYDSIIAPADYPGGGKEYLIYDQNNIKILGIMNE